MHTVGETMKSKSEYGKSINLGIQLDKFTKNFCYVYNNVNLQSLDVNIYNSKIFTTILERILKTRCAQFYVVQNSKYFEILKKYVDLKLIKVCDDVEFVFSKNNSFIFIDEMDDAFLQCAEMRSLYKILPAWMITTRKIIIIITFLEELIALSKNIDAIKKHDLKDLYFFACSREEFSLASILLLLCKNIHGIMHDGTYIFNNSNSIDTSIFEVQKKNIHTTASCVLLNCFGSKNRKYLTFNKKMTYYFIYGKKRVQSNECHDRKPFFIWLYPHSGCGRMVPPLDFVTNFLGFNKNNGIHAYNDEIFKRSNTMQYKKDITANTNLLIRLFKTVDTNSFISLHDSVYNLEEILNKTNSKVIVTTRDMRDITLSNINWFYGARIKYGHESLEDISIDFMQTKQAYPASAHFSYTGGLSKVTSELTKIKNNKNVFLLKFEDVHTDSMRAYMKLFNDFGFTQDPYWIDEILIPQIKAIALQAHSANAKITHNERYPHQLKHAQPHGWKLHFTEKMKQFFKENDNNILEVFGYENDKSW